MKAQADGPRIYHVRGSDFPLSDASLIELLRAVLAAGVPFRFRARGWSMVPFIRDGDVITVAPLGHSAPRPGDVLALLHPVSGKLLVHRAIARRGECYLIQGDSVFGGPDGWIEAHRFLGRVVRVEREDRSVRLGLGVERYLLALLVRMRLLLPVRRCLGVLRRCLLGRSTR